MIERASLRIRLRIPSSPNALFELVLAIVCEISCFDISGNGMLAEKIVAGCMSLRSAVVGEEKNDFNNACALSFRVRAMVPLDR